jgi:hypothetical protein
MTTLTPTKSASRLAEATKHTVKYLNDEDLWAIFSPAGEEVSSGWGTRAEAWEGAREEQDALMESAIEERLARMGRAEYHKLAALMEAAGLL